MTTPSTDKSKSSTSSTSGGNGATTATSGTTTSAAPTHIPDLSGAASIFSAMSEAASTPAANVAQTVNTVTNTVSTTTTPSTSAYDATRYRLVPKGDWPPPIYVDPNATEQERHYIEYRWHSQWAWYDKRASAAKKRYQQLQIMVGIGSLIVPALISFAPPDAWLQAFPGLDDTIRVATVLISLMVGAIAVLENVNKYGDNWRNFRGAAEELLREKSLYDVRSGPYRKTKNPFLLFVQRSEEIMTKQNGTFLQLAEEVQQQTQGQAQGQGQQGGQAPAAPRSNYTYSSIDSLSSEGFVDEIASTTSTTSYSTTTSTLAPSAPAITASSDADVKG